MSYFASCLTDEIGTPDPPPQVLSFCFVFNSVSVILYLSKLVIWGSSWRRGFRFHWLTLVAISYPFGQLYLILHSILFYYIL